jgi:hypothetical protein
MDETNQARRIVTPNANRIHASPTPRGHPHAPLVRLFPIALLLLVFVGVVDAITVPTNVISYVPVTLTNLQSSAYPANTVAIVGSSTTNVITGLNFASGVLAQQATCNLNNIEFFYANGTVANSWLEGNLLNLNKTNYNCNNNYAYPALASSSNVIFAIKFSNAINLLQPGSNIIYLGFAGNYISSTRNTLMTGQYSGAACYLGNNAIDNGGNVFTTYNNFCATSGTPTGFIKSSGVTLTNNANSINIVTQTQNAANGITQSAPWSGNTMSNTLELIANYTNRGMLTGGTSQGTKFGLAAASWQGGCSVTSLLYGVNALDLYGFLCNNNNQNAIISQPIGATNTVDIFSIEIDAISSSTATTANVLMDYNNEFTNTISTSSVLGTNIVIATTNTITPFTLYALITRPSWLHDSPLATSLGTTVNTPTVTISAPTNTYVDAGQYTCFTATASQGINPFTYNFIISNSVSNTFSGLVSENALITGQGSLTYQWCTKPNAGDIANSPLQANVFFTPTTGGTGNSIYSSTFTLGHGLGIPTLSASNTPSIGTGEYEIFSAYLSGGTSPYTYNFLVYNSVTNKLIINSLQYNSNTFTWLVPSADNGNTIYANVITTDSATANEITNSILTSVITIGNSLSAGAINPTSPTIDLTQSIILSSNAFGGSTPYTYQWYQTSVSVSGNAACNPANAIAGATSATYTKKPPSIGTGRWFTYLVTDNTGSTACSAADQLTTNSVPTSTITLSNTIVDVGQYTKVTVSTTGGTCSFTNQLYNISGQSPQQGNLSTGCSTASWNIHIQVPSYAQTPTSWTVGNYSPLLLTNMQNIPSNSGLQALIKINAANYSQISTIIQNVGLFTPKGTQLYQWLYGSKSNPTSTGSLNTKNDLSWFIVTNGILPAAKNQTAYNITLTNNTNHPLSTTPNPLVAVPSMPHGLYVSQDDGGYGARLNFTKGGVIRYLVNDSRISGVEWLVGWSNIEPSSNVFTYNAINNFCAVWIANGKTCIPFIMPNDYGGNQSVSPAWINTTLGVPYVASCGTGSGDGDNQEILDYFSPAYQTAYFNMIRNVSAHYAGNTSVPLIGYGVGIGAEAFPFDWGDNTCVNEWKAYGYSLGAWQGFINKTLNVEATVHRWKPTQIEINSFGNNQTFVDGIAHTDADDGVILGQAGWSSGTYSADYFAGAPCYADLCYTNNLYGLQVASAFQPVGILAPTPGNDGDYLGTFISGSMFINGAQIIYVSSPSVLIADNSSYAGASSTTCPQNSFFGSCQAYNNYWLTIGANTLGYPSGEVAVNSIPSVYHPTSQVVMLGTGNGNPDLFLHTPGNYIGLAPWIDVDKFGTCANGFDNGANVFNYYQSFCGLSSLPAGWGSSGGLTISFTNKNVIIQSQINSLANGIRINSLPSVSSTGNTVYALMNPSFSGTAGTSFGGSFGVFSSSQPFPGTCQFALGLSSPASSDAEYCVQSSTASGSTSAPTGANLYSYSVINSIAANFSINLATIGTKTNSGSITASKLVFGTTNTVPSELYAIMAGFTPPNNQQPLLRNSVFLTNSSSKGGYLTENITNPINYSFIILSTDTGSSVPGYLFNTSAFSVEINPAPTGSTFTASSEPVLQNQNENLTASISEGSSPYTYNFLVYNALGTLVYNALYENVYLNTNSTSFLVNSNWGVGLFTWDVIISDGATTPMTETNTLSFHVDPSPPVLSISSPTNTIVDAGQYETFTANLLGGQQPFAYSFNVVNSVTPSIISDSGIFGGVTIHSQVYTFQTPSIDTANSPLQANVQVIDSTIPPFTVNSPYSSTYIENPIQVPLVPTATNTIVDAGQYTTISHHDTGGTAPKTFQWYSNANAGAQICTPANAIGGATSASYLANPTSSTYYWVAITDAASTPVTSCSTSLLITANPAQITPTITPSSTPTVQVGTTETFTASETSGTSPYTYNFIVVNTVTNHQLANMLTTSSSWGWVVPSADNGNTIAANVQVTDMPTVPTTVNSIKTATITIQSGYTAPTITISTPSNSIADVGQYECFTGTVSGGTSPFAYSFNAYNPSTFTITNTMIFTGVASITQKWCYYLTGTDQANSQLVANILLTDSNPTTVNTVNSIKYTIDTALVAGAITPSNPTINSGQSQTLTSAPSGGTGSYTINWYSQASCTGSSQGTGTTYSPSPTSTTTYSYSVTDTGTTTPNIVCSAPDTINVNGALTAGAISSTNTLLDLGQYTTLTSNPSGGTPPYTMAWHSQASCAGGSVASGSSYTINPTSTTTYSYKVTDNIGATACSSSQTITVSASALGTPSLTASNTPSVNSGGYELFTASASGGTGSYTYLFKVYNAATRILLASQSGSSSTFLWQVNNNNGNTITANVFVTDSPSTPVTANSLLLSSITVQSGLAVNLVGNPGVRQYSLMFITANPVGGVAPYTYNWFINDPNAGGYYKGTQFTNIYTFSNSIGVGQWQFIAQVRDNTGLIVNSSPITVTVSNTPIIFNTNFTMAYGKPYTISAQANPSTDQANLYLTPLGQPQGLPLASTSPAPIGGVINYALCSGSNFCPTIGYWTINVIDNTSGVDPSSNFIVEAPVSLTNTTNSFKHRNKHVSQFMREQSGRRKLHGQCDI